MTYDSISQNVVCTVTVASVLDMLAMVTYDPPELLLAPESPCIPHHHSLKMHAIRIRDTVYSDHILVEPDSPLRPCHELMLKGARYANRYSTMECTIDQLSCMNIIIANL
jgi:hypothetical protein